MTTLFSRSAVEHFTQGECYDLAYALHLLTGWKISGVHFTTDPAELPPGSDEAWQHVLCRLPSGHYIDIAGIHTAQTLRTLWGGRVETARAQSRVLANLQQHWGARPDRESRLYALRLQRQYEKDPRPRAFAPLEWV